MVPGTVKSAQWTPLGILDVGSARSCPLAANKTVETGAMVTEAESPAGGL